MRSPGMLDLAAPDQATRRRHHRNRQGADQQRAKGTAKPASARGQYPISSIEPEPCQGATIHDLCGTLDLLIPRTLLPGASGPILPGDGVGGSGAWFRL